MGGGQNPISFVDVIYEFPLRCYNGMRVTERQFGFVSHLDEEGEDCVAYDCDGGLHDVGEEGGEGEAVGHVAAGAVPVNLGDDIEYSHFII